MEESLWCVVILVTLFLLYQNREHIPFEAICLGGVGLLLMFATGKTLKSSGGASDKSSIFDKLPKVGDLVKHPAFVPILVDLSVEPMLVKDSNYLNHLVDVFVNNKPYQKKHNTEGTIKIDEKDIQEIAVLAAKAASSGKCRTRASFIAENWSYPFKSEKITSADNRTPAGIANLLVHNTKLMLKNCSS